MFVEDFNEFFSSDEMADNATIGTATVTGIFESQFVEVNTYKVAGRQPDGTGLISLILERQ